MKKTTSILCLLLAGALLLTGCRKKTDPQDDASENTGTGGSGYTDTSADSGNRVENPFTAGSAKYDPAIPHGKKSVYGYGQSGSLDRRYRMDAWNDFYFKYDHNRNLMCCDRTGKTESVISCFDPICKHDTEACPAYYRFDYYVNKDGNMPVDKPYPFYIFCDYYDNAGAPVFYSVYRRSAYTIVGTEEIEREPDYVIQRYDIASGERATLLSYINELIHAVYTYGDYLYYVTSENYYDTNDGKHLEGAPFTLNALHKAGGKPIALADENTKSLDILDVTDDGVYYLVNSRYIYHCSPTLENPEMIVDMDSITDDNGNHVEIAAIRNGHLFYYGNLKLMDTLFENVYEGSCYRASLSNLSEPAVKIAEKLLCPTSYRLFTDHYLYYMPAVMGEGGGSGYYHTNHSNGVLKAVNLFTGETATCFDFPGISLETGYIIEDDSITVIGEAYSDEGKQQGFKLGRDKHIRVYADGRPAEYWYDEA